MGSYHRGVAPITRTLGKTSYEEERRHTIKVACSKDLQARGPTRGALVSVASLRGKEEKGGLWKKTASHLKVWTLTELVKVTKKDDFVADTQPTSALSVVRSIGVCAEFCSAMKSWGNPLIYFSEPGAVLEFLPGQISLCFISTLQNSSNL